MNFSEYWDCYKQVLLDVAEWLMYLLITFFVLAAIAGFIWLGFKCSWYIDVPVGFLVFTALGAYKKMADKKIREREVITLNKMKAQRERSNEI